MNYRLDEGTRRQFRYFALIKALPQSPAHNCLTPFHRARRGGLSMCKELDFRVRCATQTHAEWTTTSYEAGSQA